MFPLRRVAALLPSAAMRAAIALLLLVTACGTSESATGEPDAGQAMCWRVKWYECGEAGVSDKCRTDEQIPCSSCVEVCTSGKPCGSKCILSGMDCEDRETTHRACKPAR